MATSMLEDAIRLRAYYLWEADGRPEGRAHEYWVKAHELLSSAAEVGEKENRCASATLPRSETPKRKSAKVGPDTAVSGTPQSSAGRKKTAASAKTAKIEAQPGDAMDTSQIKHRRGSSKAKAKPTPPASQ